MSFPIFVITPFVLALFVGMLLRGRAPLLAGMVLLLYVLILAQGGSLKGLQDIFDTKELPILETLIVSAFAGALGWVVSANIFRRVIVPIAGIIGAIMAAQILYALL